MSLFTVNYKHFTHEGGTKDYDLWLIENMKSGDAMFIKRWGVVGSVGSIHKEVGSVGSLEREFDKIAKQRRKSNYRMGGHKVRNFNTLDNDAVNILGFALKRYGAQIKNFMTVEVTADDLDTAIAEEIVARKAPEEKYGMWGSF